MTELCPHHDREWRCPVCCLASLRRDLPRLRSAVRNNEKGAAGGSSSFGSRVPTGFGTAAYSLLQDIQARGGLDYIERELNTLSEPQPLNDLRRNVRQYRSRCALILHDALAPYPLLWPDNSVIGCPVVDEYGTCAAPLKVHRDNDAGSEHYGKAAIIRCQRTDDHEWTVAHAGWLRLGVLLGGVA